ncbi:MAG TPA: DUF72 domain-containing protein, partial [Pyrinomonadaceae bacterium]|nr:DUF72 domain-containing protein [Pyrinomonadaceae bacterium]
VNADHTYIRIMGERDLQKFDRIYRHRNDELEQWASSMQRIGSREIYVYMDNYFEGFAPETANKLLRLLGMPAKKFDEFSEQASLF